MRKLSRLLATCALVLTGFPPVVVGQNAPRNFTDERIKPTVDVQKLDKTVSGSLNTSIPDHTTLMLGGQHSDSTALILKRMMLLEKKIELMDARIKQLEGGN